MTDNHVSLYSFINKYYNVEELKDLCIHLGVDYDEFDREGKSGKVRGVIQWALSRHKIRELLLILQRDRREWFIKEGLRLDLDFVESIYRRTNNSVDSRIAYDPPNRIKVLVSKDAAEMKIKRLLWKMLWIRTAWLKEINIKSNLQLKYWPVFIYQGGCTVKYNFQETRNTRPFKIEDTLSRQGQTQNYQPQIRSKKFPISIVEPNLSYPGSEELLATNLMRILHQVVNGQKARTTFSNFFLGNLTIVLQKTTKLMPFLLKLLWNEFNTSIYDNTEPVWPKLTSSRRFVSSIDLPPPLSNLNLTDDFKEVILDIHKQVSAQLQSAVSNKRFIEVIKVEFFGSQLYYLMLPFWLLDAEKAGRRLTILVNGWNGNIAYLRT